MSEIRLAKINRARISDALLSAIDPVLKELETIIVTQLKQDHRSGTLSYEQSISHVSKLVVLEDLKENLKGKIKIGNKAQEDMNNDNPNE